jgi:hypothetical protein
MDEPPITEVVYRSRFAHEIELVTAQLDEAGIAVAWGASPRFGADLGLRYLEMPALDYSEYTVAVAARDAGRARDIIDGLPVSHGDDEKTPPVPPSDEP